MQNNSVKFGGAIKLSFAANTGVDPLRARVQKLIPASDGLTISLPSVSTIGSKFVAGGAPVLYLMNDSAFDIHINQPDFSKTGTMGPQTVLDVVIVPASDNPALGGPYPDRWDWELYDLNTSTNAVFKDMGLTCGFFRQARSPATAKPGTFVNVWLPTSAIPDTGGIDVNFYDEETQLCYYIHFADPVSSTPGHIPSAVDFVAITNSDIKAIDCFGCPTCFASDDGDDRGANIIDAQYGTADLTKPQRWFIGDNGAGVTNAQSETKASVFKPGAYVLQYKHGALFRDYSSLLPSGHTLTDDHPIRWYARGFQLWSSLYGALSPFSINTNGDGTSGDDDPSITHEGYLAYDEVNQDNGNNGGTGADADTQLDGDLKIGIILTSAQKLAVDNQILSAYLTDLQEPTDTGQAPPTWYIRCPSCNELQTMTFIRDSDLATFTGAQASPSFPMSKKVTLSGSVHSSYDGVYILTRADEGATVFSVAFGDDGTGLISIDAGACDENKSILIGPGSEDGTHTSVGYNLDTDPQQCFGFPSGIYRSTYTELSPPPNGLPLTITVEDV